MPKRSSKRRRAGAGSQEAVLDRASTRDERRIRQAGATGSAQKLRVSDGLLAARSRPATARLFAYGTLMRGYGLHRVLARGATYLGDARIAGRLLSLGRYPGLIHGRGSVRGELYRVDDPELLPVLDREEGYNFDRRRSVVTLANGRRARAWVYWYRGPQHRAALIPDGDFRRAHPPGTRP